MSTQTNIPEGYMENAKGGLDPIDLVKPQDKLRDQLVLGLVEKAKATSCNIAAFKDHAFNDIEAFMATVLEEYGAKHGGKKGNVTLMSYDGRYKVQRAISENLVFNESLQAAKALIDECIHEWAEGSRPEIMALINDAFQVDKEGKVSTSRILNLKRLDISDEKWLRAMQAIQDSMQVAGSKSYIRVYERDEKGEYQPIPLDVAAA